MSSPRRIVLLAMFVIVLIATALLADEAPVAATAAREEALAGQMPATVRGQFSLETWQPLALDWNDAVAAAPVHRQTDGAALLGYLERANKDDGKVFGLFKSRQAGNPSLSVAGLQAGYGEIFSREYVSPHNRNGTEIEEPTTAYLKSSFSF